MRAATLEGPRASSQMNMMLDFQPLNGHFSDYRNMATKAAYYGRDVINEAGAWLRKCFAAEARVVRLTVA